ncbi:MAG: Coenzyme F420 hydrogenase/dehydrogenase, beta subunit C-terminal domain [Candidatus Bathyarchaeota archaeon]|nr:Coenzyme F420 hydrogenase/dehydrogenase, beta subunit C-terminal domain [Candidatus Bathyarchaeota archaeon]
MAPNPNSPLKEKAQRQEALEERYLKGTRDPDLGVFCDLFSAKSGVAGQDGGVVTALLQKGLCEGLFDVAIAVKRTSGYNAEAIIIEDAQQAAAASGTCYFKVNVTAKLRELLAESKKRVAIVCTPCEASVARRIQQSLGETCEVTIIGLFCFEAFNRQRLKEQVKAQLDVDLDRVGKTQVRSGKFIAHLGGSQVSCSVKDLHGAGEGACGFCDDFVSRLADVSVGSVGSREGYSTVIVRSEVGARLLSGHGFMVEAADKAEIVRLCRFKRLRAEKSFSGLKKR